MTKKPLAPKLTALTEVSLLTKQDIARIDLTAKEIGLESFILSFKDKVTGAPILHFRQMSPEDVVNLSALSWMNGIRSNLEAHPEYSKEYREVFEDALYEFNAIAAKINERLKEFRHQAKKK